MLTQISFVIRYIMKFVRYFYWKIIRLFCTRIGLFGIFKTRVGIKQINMGALSNPGTLKGEVKLLSPDELFLGPDFLKDEFTLLGCPIKNSPHYDFMNTLLCNGDVNQSDYFKRFVDAKLDWRIYQYPFCRTQMYRLKFSEAYENTKVNKYSPVVVYENGGKYYIYDGKHRAALCALLNIQVKCLIVDDNIAWSHIFFYMFRKMSGSECFTIHNKFFKSLSHE